jgi:hypothetical protein
MTVRAVRSAYVLPYQLGNEPSETLDRIIDRAPMSAYANHFRFIP